MLDKYLLARGEKTMQECLRVRSTKHQMLADMHNKLGWDNFVEGRICKTYLQLVADGGSSCKYFSAKKWGTQLVSQLLQMTHNQWLFRNMHVHYKKMDGLKETQHEAIFKEVRELMMVDPGSLLSKY